MASPEVPVLIAKLETAQADLVSTKEKLEKLDERFGKLERWIVGLAIAAGIFGIAGAVGWNIVSGARAELSELTTKIQTQRTEVDRIVSGVRSDLAVTADTAVREAVQKNDISGRIVRIEGRIALIGTEERAADASARFGGQNAAAMDAICPTGQVVKGLKILAGGACGGACNTDGRPISFFQLMCVRQ